MGKGGNSHQRSIQATKEKRAGAQQTSTPAITQSDPPPSNKPWWRRFAGQILAAVSSFILTILMDRGYLSWIPDWTLAPVWLACLCYWLWAAGHVRTTYRARPRLSLTAILLLAIVLAVGVKYRAPLWAKVHPSKDAPYVAPDGHRALRIEGNANPTHLHCYDLPESKQIECLCPRPVDYTLKALDTPPDNNFSTEVDIKTEKDPMYRLQLFARTPIHPGKLEAFPYGEDKAAIGVGIFQIDPSSLMVQSTAPEQEFRLEVHSSEGLRLKCINQIN
ncbi:MAG: hypothetical protein WAQ52_07885 [Terriglobales bacterium]